MIKLIADIGSCWGGTIESAAKCIEQLKDIGVKYIKFQLCKNTGGNKPIPHNSFLALCKIYRDVKISASIWDQAGYNVVVKSGASWIKFAHSAYNEKGLIEQVVVNKQFSEIIITKPLMEKKHSYKGNIKYLWTYEINGSPVYPVMCQINHSNMYGKDKYDGFSCHAYDIEEIRNAIYNGAEIIEVHVNPLGYDDTPDSMFALKTNEIEKLYNIVRYAQ